MGTSVTVKVGEIDKKIREGKKYKDEEGAGWLVLFRTHHFRHCPFSLLVVSACLLHGVEIVNSLEVSSETDELR